MEIAAEHGTGVADLLDDVLSRVKGARDRGPRKARRTTPLTAEIKVAIIGRPNASGKSSLVNQLAERRAGDGERNAGHDATRSTRCCAGHSRDSASSTPPASVARGKCPVPRRWSR